MSNRAGRVRPARPAVDLDTKTLPSQDRSRATFDAILQAAGEVLAEDGIDGFSTNVVCKRAGLTPPAIYRYFPNKYALLKALGERLMEAQDDAVLAWMAQGGGSAESEAALIEETHAILREVVRVTAAFPGSVAILRAMRAVPVMREVRLASVAAVAARRFDRLRGLYPGRDEAELRLAAFLGIEVGNAMIEMIVEGEGEDSAGLLRQAAVMLARYQTGFK